MALKDWKKTRNNVHGFEFINMDNRKKYFACRRSGSVNCDKYDEPLIKGGFTNRLIGGMDTQVWTITYRIKGKERKSTKYSREKALLFAKSYMRKH